MIYFKNICVVEETWKGVLDTPKMRGFKQIFVSLFVYGNNSFCNDTKVEYAHQIAKIWQIQHNNFVKFDKILVSKYCCQRISLMYVMNVTKMAHSKSF